MEVTVIIGVLIIGLLGIIVLISLPFIIPRYDSTSKKTEMPDHENDVSSSSYVPIQYDPTVSFDGKDEDYVPRNLPKVFISHATVDKVHVEKICQILQDNGVDFWISSNNISTGANWNKEIEQALDAATHVLVIASVQSLNSSWVQAEWQAALDSKKEVIPILLENVQLPIRLRVLQYAELYQSEQVLGVSKSIAELISKLPKSRAGKLRQQLDQRQNLDTIHNLFVSDSGYLDFILKPDKKCVPLARPNEFANADFRLSYYRAHYALDDTVPNFENELGLVYLSDPNKPIFESKDKIYSDFDELLASITEFLETHSLSSDYSNYTIIVVRGRRERDNKERLKRVDLKDSLYRQLNEIPNIGVNLDFASYDRIVDRLSRTTS